MNRLQEKNELFIKLGMLFGPLQRMLEYPDRYDEQEKTEVIARYCAEYPVLSDAFRKFTEGQPGHNYVVQYHLFHDALHAVMYRLLSGEKIEALVFSQFDKATASLDSVPIPRTSVIMEARSPFTTYCKIKELCEVDATVSLVWLDPYVSDAIFHRYIKSVRDGVPITLVTEQPNSTDRRGTQRWTEFLNISRLYAKERGNALYRLVVVPTLHDRWIVFDEKRIYSLGGSAKDAGDNDYFTITNVEASAANLQSIQDSIANGTEYFGSSTPTHR